MASYLTPDWLMSDITSLLSKPKVLSREDFYDEIDAGTWGGGSFGLAKDPEVYDYAGTRYFQGTAGDDTQKEKLYQQYLDDLEGVDYSQRANIWSPEQFGSDIIRAQSSRGLGADPSAEVLDAEDQIKKRDFHQTAFTPEMFKKLRTEYYQPQLEEGRSSLLDQLMKKRRLASASGGGFAGYGGRERGRRAAGQGYRTGVEDIYAGIDEEKASALQDIYDVLSQYETIGQP